MHKARYRERALNFHASLSTILSPKPARVHQPKSSPNLDTWGFYGSFIT